MNAVVDASVALLWAQTPGSDDRAEAARELMPRLTDRAAPHILAYEVAHVIHVKRPDVFGRDTDTRSTVLHDLLETVTLEGSDMERVGRLAEEHRCSAYDAAYLELAERRGWPLVTADKRLQAAGGIGVVEALERFGGP